MSKKVCILSIDGGGIRGILPGVVLTYIEDKLREKEGVNVRLSDYFDLLAGTSTGGILTCCYITPDEQNRPKYTTHEAVDIYLKNGGKIFDISFKQKLRSGGGLTDEKYSAKELEKALEKYFGDTKLHQLVKPCLITAYDIWKRKTIFFNKTSALNEIRNYYVKDLTRATSAAPTYFEVSNIKSMQGASNALIDGGMFANNPALCAYSEARTIAFSKYNSEKPDNPIAKDMFIVSVGTGSEGKSFSYEKAKDWGLIGWIKPLIDILFSASSETVNYQLKQLFSTIPDSQNYYRLEPSNLNASDEMDDASPENLRALHEAGKKFISENYKTLDEIVDVLIANK